MSKSIDTDMTDVIICPYCFEMELDSWELRKNYGIDECGSCRKQFHYTRTTTVYYSTVKIDEDF